MTSRSLPILLLAFLSTGLPRQALCQDRPDALALYRSGKYSEAISVCQQELQETPKNIDSYVVLGWSYLKTKDYAKAFEVGKNGLDISPNDPRLIEVVGEARVFLGRLEEALKSLEEYVDLSPSGDRIARVYWLMGECYIGLRQYQNADIAVSTAVYFESKNAAWWARLGYIREMAGELKWAQEAYSRALNLDSGLTDALRGKERVDKKLGG